MPPRTFSAAKSVCVSSFDLGPRERVRRSDLCGAETGRLEGRGGPAAARVRVVLKCRGMCMDCDEVGSGCMWRREEERGRRKHEELRKS